MLTKEERAEIAERLRSVEYITSSTLFKALTGKEKLSETSQVRTLCIICGVILDLCDTPNMIELPLDKNGEIIHIGDVVYDGDREWKVSCVKYSDDSSIISVYSDNGCTEYRPDELTHKKPGTIESLVERFEIVLAKGQLSAWAVAEISDIVNQLEKLRRSDD